MRRKARDRKLRKRSFDYKGGAVWLAFKARGFVMELKKGRKGVGEERNRENTNHGETFEGHLAWVNVTNLVSCLDATSVLCAESMSGLSTNTISVLCLRQNIRCFLQILCPGFAWVNFTVRSARNITVLCPSRNLGLPYVI